MQKKITLNILISIFISISIILAFKYLEFIPSPLTLKNTQKFDSVSYTPYGKHQGPHTFTTCDTVCEERMEKDIAMLSKNFSAIRTYSVSGYDKIMPLIRKYHMKIYVGAWINNNEVDSQREMDGVIKLIKGNEDLVEGVILGNEAFLRGETSVKDLVKYIEVIRKELPGVKVTVAEVWEHWVRNIELAKHVDFLMVHILPYWENKDAIKEGVAYIHDRVDYVKEEMVLNNIPVKEIRIGETGHPSWGEMRQDAVPNPKNQTYFLREFITSAHTHHLKYNIIEAFDQPWKIGNEGVVGAYWGLYTSDRTSKGILEGIIHYNNIYYYVFGTLLTFFIGLYLLWKFNELKEKTIYLAALASTFFIKAIYVIIVNQGVVLTINITLIDLLILGIMAGITYIYFKKKEDIIPIFLKNYK